ncbi:GNAT family N-acetyltransferase [Herbidospora mongoliensis]|uniref:GNAT family N-acetyltransferase n=1 Tax=Herbidospora mongoliensis TaxID=688067 RepID=UPI00082E7EB7|nr:GNAT family N-acetyltransferase [Herbidospora mongoliensis]
MTDMLSRYARLLAASADAHVAHQGGRVARSDDMWLADFGGAAGFANGATLLREPKDLGRLADEAIAFADRQPGSGLFYFWGGWPLPEPVAPWRPDGHPPLMIREPLERPSLPHHIEEVTGDAAEFEATLARAYPLDRAGWRPGLLFGPDVHATGWRLFLGRLDDGRPVATSAAYTHDGLTEVNYVSVAPEARGQGFAAAITYAAACADPAASAMLLASELGLPVYEKMGFQVAVPHFHMWAYDR